MDIEFECGRAKPTPAFQTVSIRSLVSSSPPLQNRTPFRPLTAKTPRATRTRIEDRVSAQGDPRSSVLDSQSSFLALLAPWRLVKNGESLCQQEKSPASKS